MEETAESLAIIAAAEIQAAATLAAAVFPMQGRPGADDALELYRYIRTKMQGAR